MDQKFFLRQFLIDAIISLNSFNVGCACMHFFLLCSGGEKVEKAGPSDLNVFQSNYKLNFNFFCMTVMCAFLLERAKVASQNVYYVNALISP